MFLTQRIPRKKIQPSTEGSNLVHGFASSRLPLSQIDNNVNTPKLGHSYGNRILDKRKIRARDVQAVRTDESEQFEPLVKKHRVNDRCATEASRTYLREKVTEAKHSLSFQKPILNNCKTIDQLIRHACNGPTDFGSSSLAAFWTRAAHLLNNDLGNNDAKHDLQFRDRLNEMFIITRKTLANFGCDSICDLVIALSKIAERCQKGSYHHAMIYQALFGRRVESKGNIFDNIVHAIVPKLVRFDFRALANVAIGFARIRLNPRLDDGNTLFNRIAIHAVTRYTNEARQRLNHFDPNLLSGTAWAFAKVKQLNPAIFKMIAEESIQQMARFNSQDVAVTLWAFIRNGERNKKHNKILFRKAAERTVQFVSGLTPDALGDIAHSFAQIGIRHHPVFESIGNEAIKKLGAFTPQNLSKIVGAYTCGFVHHPNLFEKVAKKALHSLADYLPDDLCIMAYAYGTSTEVPELINMIAEEALPRLHEFEPPHLSKMVRAFALGSLKHDSGKNVLSKLFDRIAEQAMRKLDHFTPKHLSNMISAFVSAHIPHQTFFREVAYAAMQRRNQFSSKEVLSELMWSYALYSVGTINVELFSRLEGKVAALIDCCDCKYLSKIAWSYAVANVDSSFFSSERFIKAILSRTNKFLPSQLSLLHRWILWRKELKSEMLVPSDFQKLCYDAFVKGGDPCPSDLQHKVVAQLRSIDLHPQEEYRLAESGYIIDALITVKGVQICIEVDGPTHFAGRQPNGRTVLKHRLIQNIDGIRVVSIPYWEWSTAENCTGEQEYLKSKLGMTNDVIDH